MGEYKSLVLSIFTIFLAIHEGRAEPACPSARKLSSPGTYVLSLSRFQNDQGKIDFDSFDRAIACANVMLGSDPGGSHVTVVLNLPAGEIDLSGLDPMDRTAAIDLSGINCPYPGLPNCGATRGTPVTTNRFVMAGAGMNATVIKFPLDKAGGHQHDIVGILGFNVTNITITGMTFTYPYRTVSQGTVKSAGASHVIVSIPPGFPSPLDLIDVKHFRDSGRYLTPAKYFQAPNGSGTRCKNTGVSRLTNGELAFRQVAWGVPGQPDLGIVKMDEAGTLWKIPFESQRSHDEFAVNEIVAIKGKQGTDVYRFANSAFTTFDSVRWLRKSRGKFAGALKNGFKAGPLHVRITNSQISPELPIEGIHACLTTPDGGPQIGDAGFESMGHYLADNRFVGSGDDPIALFDVHASAVTGNKVMNSLGRGILFWFSSLADSVERSQLHYCDPINTLRGGYLVEMKEEGRLTSDRQVAVRVLDCP